MAVIDASVYVALMNVDEAAHEDFWGWYSLAVRKEEPVYAPVVLLAEVSAALCRGVGNPNLAHRVIRQLLGTRTIELHPVTVGLAERAAVIAADCRIRGCGAVYVPLAEETGDELVTLDRQQLERGGMVVATRRP